MSSSIPRTTTTTSSPFFSFPSFPSFSSDNNASMDLQDNFTNVDNMTENCQLFCKVNACTLEELRECVPDYIYPTPMEWLFITLHTIIFTVGVLGNFLVCFVVLRSRHMQSVTNLFIVNLAVADLIVLIFSSPPTVLQTVTESWFLGEAMCKIAHLIQTQSIAVSVQTLCAIAVERYFAICRPLKSRITRKKVTITVLTIWTVGTSVALPSAVYMQLQPSFVDPELSKYLAYCELDLHPVSERVYNLVLIVALYLVPMVTIGVFYAIISHHLWNVQVPGVTVRGTKRELCYRSHTEAQLSSRKKVAKMLIAIVLLFAMCYLPLNLLFALRYTNILNSIRDWEGLPIVFTTAHWLVYFNSAFNPVVYNFMSAKFKKEFRSVFRCYRSERSHLLHESTFGQGKFRVQQRTPITQSTELDPNGAHV
ncbi:orexin/Hypocretin receptor type 1-like [Littorina saxatilis]|uniref:orexin/Hypocretin receptor type 1-like n=1 Tax=Littorina saxatilis TaxID=31220 RepID=UPI0038B50C36